MSTHNVVREDLDGTKTVLNSKPMTMGQANVMRIRIQRDLPEKSQINITVEPERRSNQRRKLGERRSGGRYPSHASRGFEGSSVHTNRRWHLHGDRRKESGR